VWNGEIEVYSIIIFERRTEKVQIGVEEFWSSNSVSSVVVSS